MAQAQPARFVLDAGGGKISVLDDDGSIWQAVGQQTRKSDTVTGQSMKPLMGCISASCRSRWARVAARAAGHEQGLPDRCPVVRRHYSIGSQTVAGIEGGSRRPVRKRHGVDFFRAATMPVGSLAFPGAVTTWDWADDRCNSCSLAVRAVTITPGYAGRTDAPDHQAGRN